MEPKDFYQLRIGQSIWWKGKLFTIDTLGHSRWSEKQTITIYGITLKESAPKSYQFYFEDICSDCSLEAPKEKKKYYAHIIKYNPFSRQDRTDLGIIFLDDDGKTLSGVEPSKEDCKALKKIESFFLEE